MIGGGASGSVGSASAHPPSRSPRASAGRKRARCASLPKVRSGQATSDACVATIAAVAAETRASSSSATAYATASSAVPPHVSGMPQPRTPSRPSSVTMSRGNRPLRSISAATGWMRRSAKSRIASRSWRWVSVSSTRTLPALPDGRPLLAEGVQPLATILGGERQPERLDLVATACGQPRRTERRRALGLAHRDRRLGGERGTELRRLRPQPISGHDAVHEADPVALLGRDHVTEVHELAGAREPDAQGEALCAAEPRDQPEVDLGLPEPCALRRDDQVAGERQLQPAAEGDAVERGDDRHVELLEPREHLVA